jgi:hypothetical protein
VGSGLLTTPEINAPSWMDELRTMIEDTIKLHINDPDAWDILKSSEAILKSSEESEREAIQKALAAIV